MNSMNFGDKEDPNGSSIWNLDLSLTGKNLARKERSVLKVCDSDSDSGSPT